MSDRRTDGAARGGSGAAPPSAADELRIAMMRRVKRMSLEERIALFERLTREAAWASGARRVR